MVLVKHEVPVGTIDGIYSPTSNARPSTDGKTYALPHPSQSPTLPQEAYESTFLIKVPTPDLNHFCGGPHDNQMRMMLLEYHNKKRRMVAPGYVALAADARLPSNDEEMQTRLLEYQAEQRLLMQKLREEDSQDPQRHGASRQDYHMQMMQLEHANKKRLTEARQLHDSRANNPALQDYQMQLMLSEQQNKKRLCEARQLYGNNSALQDYQTQMMLLEQQNKRRHILAMQQEQVRVEPPVQQPVYQSQLMLLEQQNKRRLMMRWAEEEEVQNAIRAGEPGRQNPVQTESESVNEPVQFNRNDPTHQSPIQTEDKWGKGPFPAGQGVIQGYQIQMLALHNRQREAAAMRSQTSVEFSEQRQRYQSELMSAQSLPGTPGTSCTPPETPESSHSAGEADCCEPRVSSPRMADRQPLVFRPAPGRGAGFDELYDS